MNTSAEVGMEVMGLNDTETAIKDMQPFMELMMYYECALMEIETKLKVLNSEFNIQHNRNPFESIKSRVKKPMSIIKD